MDTGKVQDRRRLRFSTIDGLLDDVESVVAAEKAGRLRRTLPGSGLAVPGYFGGNSRK
jgi:hypothetical protein